MISLIKKLALLALFTLLQKSIFSMEKPDTAETEQFIERSALGSPLVALKLSPFGQNCLFGSHIWLRPIFPQDWESAVPLFTNKEAMKNFASGRTYTDKEIQQSTKQKAQDVLLSTPQTNYCWSIISHDGIVGRIYTLEAEGDLGRLELSYAIVPQFNGRGFATKAAQLVLDRLNKPFMATAHPENRASQHILEKLGFTRDLLRQNVYKSKFSQYRDYFLFQPKKQMGSGEYMAKIFCLLLGTVSK